MVANDSVAIAPEIAERVARRSARDLQSLYLDDVFRYVSAFVRPPAEAEDVTMEVFYAAFTSLGKLRRKDDPRLWLLGIARRKVADSLRKRYRRHEEQLAASTASENPDIDGVVVLAQVLDQLPKDQSEALVLKYVTGLSIDEIGVALGRSTAAANSLLQRARGAFYDLGASHFLDPKEDQR